jgi:GcrA cell cycle regulator
MALQPPSLPGDARDPPPRTSRNLAWPGELIDRLKALWNGNRLTAEQMARRLGISRNALIGKAHRLGLSTHKARVAKPQRRKLAPKMKPLPPPPIVEEDPVPAEPEFAGVELLALGPKACRYPQGDGVPYRFCGAPQLEGSSYCPYHQCVCYHPLSRRPVYIPPPWADHRGRR